MRFWRRLKMVGRKPFLESNEQIADSYIDNQKSKTLRNWLTAAGLVILLLTGLGWYWSGEPDLFDVREQTAKILDNRKPWWVLPPLQPWFRLWIHCWISPAGTSNDLMPPGVLLDNIPSWEFGVLVQVRDLSKAMREAFSRSQSQSTEDADLAIAEPRFHIDHRMGGAWPNPNMPRGGSTFFAIWTGCKTPRPTTPNFLPGRTTCATGWELETRLGSLSQRLSASVGQRRINTDLSGDAAGRQSTQAADEVVVKTSWMKIDNVFYEARGTTWALLHFLRAIEVDFGSAGAQKCCCQSAANHSRTGNEPAAGSCTGNCQR